MLQALAIYMNDPEIKRSAAAKKLLPQEKTKMITLDGVLSRLRSPKYRNLRNEAIAVLRMQEEWNDPAAIRHREEVFATIKKMLAAGYDPELTYDEALEIWREQSL